MITTSTQTVPRIIRLRRREAGNVILLCLGIIITLAILSAVVLNILGTRHRQAFQTAAWHNALLAAEGGVDTAVAELRQSLVNPTAAFSSWTRADGSSGGPNDGSTYFTSSVLLRSGEGGQRSWATIEVSAPATLRDDNGTQWYRVRSTGYSEVSGGRVLAGNSMDVQLRKLNFHNDRRASAEGRPITVNIPNASRVIEVIIKPVGAFRAALFAEERIDMNNHNIVVDSYDSTDPAKSTNAFYDPAKRQENGDIATNGSVIDVGNAHIYGDASTNGGSVLRAGNVTGTIHSDFYNELFPVSVPTMTPHMGTPSVVRANTTITATPSNPLMVILSEIKLSGSAAFRINGAADGSPTYAQILVNGDISLSGQGQIILGPGVNLRLFVVGNADLTGNGVANPNRPLNFQMYGVEQLNPSIVPEFKIAGNGGFRGSLYAPNYLITMVGGGHTDSIFGSFAGRRINMTGVQSVHYDEAMADAGLVSDFKVVSWFEDNR